MTPCERGHKPPLLRLTKTATSSLPPKTTSRSKVFVDKSDP